MARAARAALQRLPELEPPEIDLGSLAAGGAAAPRATAVTSSLPTGLAAEPPAPTERAGVGPGGREPARGPGRAGHRRTPARWQVRLAQGALAAAAVAVAVGVFANLGGHDKLTPTGSSAASGPKAAIEVPAAAPTRPTQAYTAKSFAAFAADLVGDIRKTRPQDRSFGAALSEVPSPTPGLPFVEQALSCLQEGTGLVTGRYPYYVQGATYEGTPVYLGAFVSGPGKSGESLVVVAVSVDGCRALQIIHEAV